MLFTEKLSYPQKSDQINSFYFVSDNTGHGKGGSEDLQTTGYRVSNTKTDGNIRITTSSFNSSTIHTGKRLGN